MVGSILLNYFVGKSIYWNNLGAFYAYQAFFNMFKEFKTTPLKLNAFYSGETIRRNGDLTKVLFFGDSHSHNFIVFYHYTSKKLFT
jgi:hypothetical protein